MKKVLLILMSMLFITGCTRESYVEKKPSVNVEESNFVRESVRVMNVDGEFYFDSRMINNEAKCGVLDGGLQNIDNEFKVPKNDGECNFEANGYQVATELSIEVPIDGKWVVFKKIDSYGENLKRFEYVYLLRGTHPNAVKESEYIIFANSLDITFDKITKYFFSSLLEDHMLDIKVIYPHNSDEWGIMMYAEDVTKTSLTLKIEQFGGEVKGTLQTGTWFEIERMTDKGWEKVEYLPSEYVRAWNSVAYHIKERDITEFEVNWKNLYGELPLGEYRIAKKIMDFVESGEREEKIYYQTFTIEESGR